MPKRKLFQQDISTRYRRKLIREESEELFVLFNEPRTNSCVILNNSVSGNDHHDESVNLNRVISEIEKQDKAINLPCFDLTNISESDFF